MLNLSLPFHVVTGKCSNTSGTKHEGNGWTSRETTFHAKVSSKRIQAEKASQSTKRASGDYWSSGVSAQLTFE